MFDLNNFPVIGFDTEGTGLYYPRDYAFAFGFAALTPDGPRAFSIDLRSEPQAREYIQHQIRNYRGIITAHNASFDVKMSASAGVTGFDLSRVNCTVTRACLINEHEGTVFPWTKGKPGGYGLDHLAQKYAGYRKNEGFLDAARAFFGNMQMSKDKVMSRMVELPWDIIKPYLEDDCIATLMLWYEQEKIIEAQGLRDIVEFEQSVFPEIVKAEMRGIDVSTSRAEAAQPKLTKIIDEKTKILSDMAGWEFNVNSGPQIIKLFDPKQQKDGSWLACDGTQVGTTGKGKPSFKSEFLHEMSHPAASLITEIRSLIKTRDTFLGTHILQYEYKGKVYPTINQTAGEDGGTRTGRLSYVDPAMQQIPARNKAVAAIVKPCFLPPQGMKWLEPDLQSFEVRIFAHLVSWYNDALVEAYKLNPNLDFHQWVADMTHLVRNAEYSGQPNAKQLNLSMIFNQGKGATAKKMGMPWEWAEFNDREGNLIRYMKAGPEAEAVIAQYHQRVQGVKTLADRCKSAVESRGYIATKSGRRLRFPGGYKSYKASGLLIQATSADENKRNWVLIGEALGNDGHLILNTHDSYSMAVPEDWKPAWARVKEAIEAPRLRVPLILELDGVGDDWWAAKCGGGK